MIILINGSLKAQTIDETLHLASFYFENEEYEKALDFYSRAMYFSGEKNEVSYKVAQCYQMIGNLQQAIFYFDYTKNNSNDSLKTEAWLSKVQCLMKLDKNQMALGEMYSITPPKANGYLFVKYNFVFGLLLFEIEEFDRSEDHFSRCISKEKEQNILQLNSLFNSKSLHKPNVGLAKTLSIIVPGTGQIYTGNLKEGVNSIVLTGGLIALFVYTGINFSILDATISVMPWYQRYYWGGHLNAENLALQKLERNRNLILLQVFALLENQPFFYYKG